MRLSGVAEQGHAMLYAKSRFQGVMRKKQIIKILAAIAVVALLNPALCGAIEFKGVSYTGWNRYDYSTTDSNTSLANAQNIGCNWVAICVWWFQDNINSTVIAPDYNLYSVDPCSVQVAVNRCHQLGMRVMLKPMVDLSNDSSHWRGQITPSTAWFTAYHGFIDYWADFATANNCEMFCIGCELVNTDGSSWAGSWSSVASDVRTHYSGPITYAANWGDERNITWWNDVNYIGIDAYYPLTTIDNPTPAKLVTAWTSRANSIGSWRSTDWPDMNVMFTEVGYCSYAGTNIAPWNGPSSSSVLDINEQNNCYMALLSVCRNYSWWKGAFWWNWETDPNAGGLDNNDYTPQNKPASTVTLREYYITNEALNITNCNVTAGKTQYYTGDNDYNDMEDTFTAWGTVDLTDVDVTDINKVVVTITSVSDGYVAYTEDLNDFNSTVVNSKHKYTHSAKLTKGEAGKITSLTLDFRKGTFAITSKNLDLTGLACPLRLEITMGNYTFSGHANEAIVNGPKMLIPTRLMRLYKDTHVVNKAKAKHNSKKASSDTFSVTGDITVENMNLETNEPNLVTKDVVLTWGDINGTPTKTLTLTIPGNANPALASFKVSGKGHVYNCSKVHPAEDPNSSVAAQFDLDQCTFTVSVSKASFVFTGPSDPNFSVSFDTPNGEFYQAVDVNLSTGRSY